MTGRTGFQARCINLVLKSFSSGSANVFCWTGGRLMFRCSPNLLAVCTVAFFQWSLIRSACCRKRARKAAQSQRVMTVFECIKVMRCYPFAITLSCYHGMQARKTFQGQWQRSFSDTLHFFRQCLIYKFLSWGCWLRLPRRRFSLHPVLKAANLGKGILRIWIQVSRQIFNMSIADDSIAVLEGVLSRPSSRAGRISDNPSWKSI